MGCDIHAYVEYRPAGRSDWLSFGGQFVLYRNYDIFGHIAAVRRGDIKPVVPPRGIPDDLGFSTKDHWGESDWHTPGWLTVDEYWDALARAHEHGGVSPQAMLEWSALGAAMTQFKTLGSAVRFVFWFDN